MMRAGPSVRKYETTAWADSPRSPLLHRSWESLLSARDTPAAAYQSPVFLDYLREAEQENRFEVLTVSDAQQAIVGVVPIKISNLRLSFTFGPHKLAGLRLKGLNILGSEPMVLDDAAALDSLFLALPARYPEVRVVYMNEVPQESYLWRYLGSSAAIRSLYDIHVLDGFRECHTVIVPSSLDEYHQKLGKKKQYNLKRQERLLEENVGPLELIAIDRPENLFELLHALDVLAPVHLRSAMHRRHYVSSSRYGFLKCFVLKAGGRPVALALGTKAGQIYKVHRLFHDKSLGQYSPGTTLWQRILRELVVQGEFTSIDMGYGAPAHRFRATNVVEHKGRILLFRRSVANQCRVLALSGYAAAVDLVKRQIGREARPV